MLAELQQQLSDIYQVAGSGHHALAIIGSTGIAVVDAPWFPERSATILRQMAERWPELPIRYIIVTHHHIDHTGGFRSFVEAGATLVAHEDLVPARLIGLVSGQVTLRCDPGIVPIPFCGDVRLRGGAVRNRDRPAVVQGP